MLKAEVLLKFISDIKPGQYISWPIYVGDDIQEAKSLENYVTPFFKTGSKMPIPVFNLGLDIHSVESEYDDKHHAYRVTVEGFITTLNNKGGNHHE